MALQDFRNYERAGVDFAAGLNLIVGRNAQGKTNLVEAIYCLCGMGSPRAPDASLVRRGTERAVLHGEVERSGRRVDIDLEMRPGRGTRALINKTPASSLAMLGEVASCVFFGPDELSVVKGSPDGRRKLLDDLVVKMRPARHGLRREFDRVLKQRNALLKSAPKGGSGASTLDVWDEALCRTGAALASTRLEVLAHLIPFAAKRFETIGGGGRIELAYESAWLPAEMCARAVTDPGAVSEDDLRGALESAVASARAREIERGLSLVGPQRDDVAIRLTSEGVGVLDARAYASQGEQRTGSLALKLGEYDLLAEVLGDDPILLLDDVFSELDPHRRAWLGDAVRAAGQTIVTSAEPGAVEAAGADRVVEVRGGRLTTR